MNDSRFYWIQIRDDDMLLERTAPELGRYWLIRKTWDKSNDTLFRDIVFDTESKIDAILTAYRLNLCKELLES